MSVGEDRRARTPCQDPRIQDPGLGRTGGSSGRTNQFCLKHFFLHAILPILMIPSINDISSFRSREHHRKGRDWIVGFPTGFRVSLFPMDSSVCRTVSVNRDHVQYKVLIKTAQND